MAMMPLAVLSGFALAILAPWIVRLTGRAAGWILAVLPAVLTVYFWGFVPAIAGGETLVIAYEWIPGLGIDLSFYVDGLSLLFALLISGIGTFIVIYAGGYLAGHRDLGRFYVIILAFMASMLGLVLADNLITLFIFWELTSITSYLLIGFDHEKESARKAALQGLIVTVAGGLALLAGLVLMAIIGGSLELTELAEAADDIRGHALYPAILVLVLLGAFTKSAQWPFHFWLPNAMAAPTPVSAYLHSATMVKAGVYLLARLNPTLGDTEMWMLALTLFGGITMVLGAFLAVHSTDIKRVLAYSTVMALGTLTMLIGIGTEGAAVAAAVFLLAHSLYKGALFMAAGAVDHETGTREVPEMGGLRRAMPITTVFTAVAALSLAGLPPLFGFIGKELLYEAVLDAPALALLLTLMAMIASLFVVAAAAIVGIRPFYGKRTRTPKQPHEAPVSMWIGVAILATLGLILGLAPYMAEDTIVPAAASAIAGRPLEPHLTLWHGFNLPLALSVTTVILGLVLYIRWDEFRAFLERYRQAFYMGPERWYEVGMDGLNWTAAFQTRVLQNGYMRNYLITILLTTVALTTYTLIDRLGINLIWDIADVRFYEMVIAAMVFVAAIAAVGARSRLGAVATLGVFGFAVALIYVLFGAPDLGITQILVETLTVLLFVLVLYWLPEFARLSSTGARLRDAVVAVATGATMTLLLLITIEYQFYDSVSAYFVDASEPLAHGRNIVNVILVDFRALDTLGEITVLALAAIGVFAMIKFRPWSSRS